MKFAFRLSAVLFLFVAAAAVHSEVSAASRNPQPEQNSLVDIKLPITTPTTDQWIVIVNGTTMDIVPATTKKTEGGVFVSASVPSLPAGALQAAIAVVQDGSVFSTPLHPAR